jgi:putative flippase GtrA
MAWPPEAGPVMRGRILRTLLADPRSRAWLLFLRFGLVGLVNTGFGYGVFALLVLVGIWSGAALVMSTIAGVAFNFQTSRRLVFRSSGRTLRFIAVYVVVLALNWAALRTLRRYGLPDLESQAFLTLPIAAMSFLGQRTFVFGPTNGPA